MYTKVLIVLCIICSLYILHKLIANPECFQPSWIPDHYELN